MEMTSSAPRKASKSRTLADAVVRALVAGMCDFQEIQALGRRHHENATRRVRQDGQRFKGHADVVPAARVRFKC